MIKNRGINVFVFFICLLFFLLIFFNFESKNITGNSFFENFFLRQFYIVNSYGRVFISQIFQITIYSPENKTYYFNRSTNMNLSLNVSSNRNISLWNYSVYDIHHNGILVESGYFIPNFTIKVVRWENLLVVSALDVNSNKQNAAVYFYVFVNNSAPVITNLTTPKYLCEEGALTDYYFNITDIDEYLYEIIVNYLWPSSPFYIAPLTRFNLTNWGSELFSGTLTKDDIGGVNSGWYTYKMEITASDGENVDTKYANITIIEINHYPNLENIGVQTVWNQGDNSTFLKQVNVSDIESGFSYSGGYFSYNISFSNITLFNISTNGTMYFNATNYSVGVHNITVCAIDSGIINEHPNISIFCPGGGGNKGRCNNFSLTITNENRAPKIISYYPRNLSFSASGNQVLYFNITKYDPDRTIPDAYWYVDGIFREYDSGSLNDIFVHTFGCGVSGNHSVVVYITDGLLSTSLTWNINVLKVDCPVIPAERPETGGGAPSPIKFCKEIWGCSAWGECYSMNSVNALSLLKTNLSIQLKSNCTRLNYTGDSCGYQTRICIDKNACNTTYNKPGDYRVCQYTEKPNCNDKIKNCHDGACEILTDCGGPCDPCPTCSDEIQNQGEEGIDCGGPCEVCKVESPVKKVIEKSIVYLILLIFFISVLIILVLLLIYIKYKRKLEETLEETKGLQSVR